VSRLDTILPKRTLVEVLMSSIPGETLRAHFKIRAETDLINRLQSFSKADLLTFADSQGEQVLSLIRETETRYPLRSPASAYLLCIDDYMPDKVLSQVSDLFVRGLESAMFWDDAPVRAVYVSSQPTRTSTPPGFVHFQLAYEIAVKYVVADPDAPDRGELKVLFSLERALMILPDTHAKHALVYCSDFEALRCIIQFLRELVGVYTYSPNLTEDTLHELSNGAIPRTASFGRVRSVKGSDFDVETIMIADSNLRSSEVFKHLRLEKWREQKSGYYTSHPAVGLGGLGISRRYGRIWTPARLTIDELVKLGADIIHRVEGQVDSLPHDQQLAYHWNMPLRIGDKPLGGGARRGFYALARAIMEAINQQDECTLEREDIVDILRNRKTLHLSSGFRFECGQCGLGQIAHCPGCGKLLKPKFRSDKFSAACSCGQQGEQLSFRCSCGHDEAIADLWAHLCMWPEPEILDALDTVIKQAGASFKGSFYVDGGTLRILQPISPEVGTVLRLEDLKLWQRRARIQFRNVDSQKILLDKILKKAREKCIIDNKGPDRARCSLCLDASPAYTDLVNGKICLLRMFGIPIGLKFDGIHSAAEMADIKYCDYINNTAFTVGIHVKSRDPRFKRRLGRSSSRLQSLYAQYCHSVYQVAMGKWPFDVLGIAVPQDMDDSMHGTFTYLAKRTGIRLLVMQLQDWRRIASAAVEEIKFKEECRNG
jgi:hypothetical protein